MTVLTNLTNRLCTQTHHSCLQIIKLTTNEVNYESPFTQNEMHDNWTLLSLVCFEIVLKDIVSGTLFSVVFDDDD